MRGRIGRLEAETGQGDWRGEVGKEAEDEGQDRKSGGRGRTRRLEREGGGTG